MTSNPSGIQLWFKKILDGGTKRGREFQGKVLCNYERNVKKKAGKHLGGESRSNTSKNDKRTGGESQEQINFGL